MEGGQDIRADRLSADGQRRSRALSPQHVEEAARGKNLPRLSAQRPQATAVAVLSPRARAGATVSMPFTWRRSKAVSTRSASQYAPCRRLLRKTKAWEGYDEAAASVKAAIGRLASKK